MSDQESDGTVENRSETDSEQACSNLIMNLYLNKRQEMKVRLLEAETELDPELQAAGLVCIIGEPSPPMRKEPVQPILSVRSSWLRVHNKKWILGITLLNTSQSETVSLSTPALLTVPWLPVTAKSHFMSWVEGADLSGAGPSLAKRPREAASWRALDQLPPGALAHALTVVDVDLSWPDVVVVKQGFEYSVKGVKDGVTSVHELTARGSKDPAQRVFPRSAARAPSPTSTAAESVLDCTPGAPAQLDLAPEMLSVQLTSECMDLVVQVPATYNLRRQLTKTFGFETASSTAPLSYLLHRGARNPLLKGVMLIARREAPNHPTFTMRVYTRDPAQSERFLRAIIALPDVTVSAAQPPSATKLRLAQALRQEQRFVQTQLARMLREPEISEERFRRFRLRLSDIELATDKLALGTKI